MPAGRPSPYTPDLARIAERLCRNGSTDSEIAEILGICLRTFYRWRGKHDAFNAAITTARQVADDRVERALYQRAVGYEYRAEKIVSVPGGKPERVPYTVHMPADVRAAMHWLAMRRPQPWAGAAPAPDVDIARIIADARQRVARDADLQQAAGRPSAAAESVNDWTKPRPAGRERS